MLGDVVLDQLGVQADVARRPDQVVMEGGHALAAVTVARHYPHKGIEAGQIRQRVGQPVKQRHLHAVAGGRPQHRRL